MLTRWSDFDRTLAWMDEFRRRMDRMFDDSQISRPSAAWEPFFGVSWPRANLYDGGESLVVTAELPGIGEKDLQISANQDGVTISGERKVETPKGWSVHRQERPGYKFSRSFAFPCKVDTEKASATLKDGILTLSVPKVPEAQPRRISVRAG